MTLKCLKPLTITDSILTASNVTEDDYPAWVSGTTYALGDFVIRTSTHKVYRRLIAGSGTTTPESDTTNWMEYGPTNRWKSFDLSNTTATTKTGNITYTLTPGTVVSSVAFVNVTATSISVTMTDLVDGTIYDKTVSMQAPPKDSSWYSYFFDEIGAKTFALFDGLPSYRAASIEIEIAAASTASVGVILIGTMVDTGIGPLAGASLSISDYSRKERDEFGNYVLVRRGWAKKATYDTILENSRLDSVAATLSDIRAVPCLWIGSHLYESSILYGIYKDFNITIAYPEHSQVTFELEGLI